MDKGRARGLENSGSRGSGEGAECPGSCLILSGPPNVCDRELFPTVTVGDLENLTSICQDMLGGRGS